MHYWKSALRDILVKHVTRSLQLRDFVLFFCFNTKEPIPKPRDKAAKKKSASISLFTISLFTISLIQHSTLITIQTLSFILWTLSLADRPSIENQSPREASRGYDCISIRDYFCLFPFYFLLAVRLSVLLSLDFDRSTFFFEAGKMNP